PILRDVEDVRATRLGAEELNAIPLALARLDLRARVRALDVAGDGFAEVVDLDATEDVLSRRLRRRVAYAVRFDEADPQIVHTPGARDERERREDVAARERRDEREPLDLPERHHPRGVAVLRVRPHAELSLGVDLPGVRLVGAKAEEFKVNARVQAKASADDVRPDRLHRAGRDGHPHHEIAASLAKLRKVVDDVRVGVASGAHPPDERLLDLARAVVRVAGVQNLQLATRELAAKRALRRERRHRAIDRSAKPAHRSLGTTRITRTP